MLSNHTRGREYTWGTRRENCVLAYAGWDKTRSMLEDGCAPEDIQNALSAQATEYLAEPYLLEHSHALEEDYYVSCQAVYFEKDLINLVGGEYEI